MSVQSHQQPPMPFFAGYICVLQPQIEQYKEIWNRLDILKSLVPWAFVVQIVSSASNILINGSMLYGVIQKKAGFMLPWLIFGMISIVVSIFNTFLIQNLTHTYLKVTFIAEIKHLHVQIYPFDGVS